MAPTSTEHQRAVIVDSKSSLSDAIAEALVAQKPLPNDAVVVAGDEIEGVLDEANPFLDEVARPPKRLSGAQRKHLDVRRVLTAVEYAKELKLEVPTSQKNRKARRREAALARSQAKALARKKSMPLAQKSDETPT